MAIDHDQIFKMLIELFFREFMVLFCPAEAKRIDFSKVEFLREELFTDVKRGRRKRLDLVVKVGLRVGGEKFILVHVEFEASRKQEDFPQRMFKYFCQLLLRYALMAKMNYNRKERVRLKADFLRLILGTRVDLARRSVLTDFVEAYMVLDRKEETEFQQIVKSQPQYRKVQKMLTTYEKYEREGMKKGRAEGRAEGRRETLILLMEKKFGKLSPSVKKEIRQIDSEKRLESLLLSVLDANSLDDLEL